MIATEVISPWTVYWITRLNALNVFLFVMFLFTAGFWFVFTARTLEDVYTDKDSIRILKKSLKWVLIPVGFLLAFLATPTTKQVCAIYLIPKIANNESVQEIGVDIKTLARDWLEELRPAGKKAEPAKGE